MTLRRKAWPLIGLALGCGCGLVPNNTSDGGGGMNGYGRPTLLLTLNGVHVGPATPDPGSGAALATQRDGDGRVTQSTLRIAASSAASGAACQLAAFRSGADRASIGAGSYTLIASNSASADGVADPLDGEAVGVPQGAWRCTYGACNGAALAIQVLDATHIEGYFAGGLASTNGGAVVSAVCSFYLPMLAYQP